MLNIERATRNAQAQSMIVIDADPAALRECADRIEAMARQSNSGQSVLCPLTAGITVIHKPENDSRIFLPESSL